MVENALVDFSTEIKYLGVIITNNLSWERWVTNITKKMRTVLYQLKLRKLLTPDILKMKFVTTLILSHIDYCSFHGRAEFDDDR